MKQTTDKNLKAHIVAELAAAAKSPDEASAFQHLERAHVLGQSHTLDHTRIHWQMLKFAIKTGNTAEIFGQILRIIGAATKTPFGIYPRGNTGGSNVWFFKPMPIPEDLQQILDSSK